MKICMFGDAQHVEEGDPLYVKVNKLSSTKTQLPYDYYYLNYCKPSKILNNAENLGEVLRGDRIENSVYTFQNVKDQPCKVGCRVKLDADATKNFKEKIDDEYRANMYVVIIACMFFCMCLVDFFLLNTLELVYTQKEKQINVERIG